MIVVGGALAVASVGYGLGTQADDGTAVAGGDPSSERRGHPPGFQALAEELGVDADKLARALRDFHASEEGDRRDEFASALAKALGISADKVGAAFEQLREQHEARFAARLAEALSVDADRVKAAFEKLRDDTPRPPHEFAEELADELGVEVTDVRRALFEARPEPGGMHRHRAVPLRRLASALGVSRAELRTALAELRGVAEDRFEEHHQALAEFLAKRFDLSTDDVAEALDELPHPPPPGRGDRPGLGGPGHGPARIFRASPMPG